MPSLGILNLMESTSQTPTPPRRTALAEFQSRLQAAQRREQSHEGRFQTWQRRWADVKGPLIERMEAIDEQLARMADDKRMSPKLTIVRHDERDC